MGKGLGSVHSHQINHDRCKHQDVSFKYFYIKAYNLMKVLHFLTAPRHFFLQLL